MIQPEVLPEFSRKIELTRGLFAIVDEDLFEKFNQWNWSAMPDYRTVYAIRGGKLPNGKHATYRMHREVLGLVAGDGVKVDHKNGNGLDNRRCNLEITTNTDNQLNRHTTEKFKSRFKGVIWHTDSWSSFIKHENKTYRKNFQDEFEAAKHYDITALELRGPSHKTNYVLERYTTEEIARFTADELSKLIPNNAAF